MKSKVHFLLVAAPLVALLVSGCAPNVVVLGLPEKTALENQVIGTYEYLREEDRLFLAEPGTGVRGVPPEGMDGAGDPAAASVARKNVVKALLHQEYQRLDVLQFKSQGWIGEKRTGYLDLFPDRIPGEYRERIERLVSEENTDRRTVVDGIIAMNPKLDEKDRPEIEAVFARLYREAARPGEWVQSAAGRWVQIR